MKHVIFLDEKPITLVYEEFEDDIVVNDITKIDYSNLYGEVVTISTLINRIGQLRSEAEKIMDTNKFEVEIQEAEIKKRLRRDAAESGSNKFTIKNGENDEYTVKLTENSLNEAVLLDVGYQITKKNYIKSKRDYGNIDSLFWAISDKSKKLNNMLKQVTPEELYNEIIDCSINGILIKKPKLKK